MAIRPGYKTTHEVARALLDGPDVLIAIAAPVFDMPGAFNAMPFRTEVSDVQGDDVVLLVVDTNALKRQHDTGPVPAPGGT